MGGALNLTMSWEWRDEKGDFFVLAESFRKSVLSDYIPVWSRVIREVLEPYVIRQFDSEGGQGQEPWAELAESTVKQRGSEHPILFRDGHLMSSFIQGGEGHIEEIGEKEMAWGSSIPYALFHQTGTGRGYLTRRVSHAPIKKSTRRKLEFAFEPMFERGMAQRPILDFLPGWEDPHFADVRRIFMAESLKQATAAGFGVISRGEAAGMEFPDIRDIGRIALGAK